jgi:carboxyl-terminal processing protease
VDPQEERTDREARYRSSLLFASVLELVRDEYVDPRAVDYERLTEAALEGMMRSLDPYSEYLNAERFMEVRSDTEGEFGGIGVYVGVQDKNTLIVTMPVAGGPGFRAGLLPGDWVVEVDGESTKGLGLNELIKRLRGRPGEAVRMLVYRPSTQETREVRIVRELINVPTVRDACILPAGGAALPPLGYLRIVQFGEKTLVELNEALEQLRAGGMAGLILDLRNNPGGLLDAAVQVAGRFTEPGRIIASTEGRPGRESVHYLRAEGVEHDGRLPLVVLVNRHSASGAEIVAGALKDLGRALLVGEQTYGKGSVQTVQKLDLAVEPPVGLRLTTALYFTPSRQVIHDVGIVPQVEVPVTEEEERAIYRRQNWHILPPEERQALEEVTDRQLVRARVALRGMLAYETLHGPGARAAK